MSSHPEVFHGHCRSNIDVESDKQLNVLSSHIPAHHLVLMCWCLQHATQCRGKSRVLLVLRVLQVFFWFWHGRKQVLGQGDEMLRKTLTWGNLLQLVILALNVWTCLNYSEIIRIVGVCGAGKLSWCCDPQSSGDKAAKAFNCSIEKIYSIMTECGHWKIKLWEMMTFSQELQHMDVASIWLYHATSKSNHGCDP